MKNLLKLLLVYTSIFSFTNCFDSSTESTIDTEIKRGDLTINMEYAGSEVISDQQPIYVWTGGSSLVEVDLSNGFSTVQTTYTETIKDTTFSTTLKGFVDLNGDKKINDGEPYSMINVQEPGNVNLIIYDSSWFTFKINNIQATKNNDPYNPDGIMRRIIFTEKSGTNYEPVIKPETYGTTISFVISKNSSSLSIINKRGGIYDILCYIDFNDNDGDAPDVVNGISDKYIIIENVVINGNQTLEVDYADFNFAK